MITGIRVRNFKSLKEIEIQTRQLNLLAGLNGMGKSSLIQILLLIRQSYMQGALYRTGLMLKGPLADLGTGKDIFYQYAGEEEFLELGLATSGKAPISWKFNYSAEKHILPLVKSTNLWMNESEQELELFTNNFQYLTAEHISPQSLYNKSQLDVIEYKQIGVRGEFAPHYLSEFGLKEKVAFSNLIHPNAKSDTLIHNVDAWLSEITPGTRIAVEDLIAIDQIRLSYQFETKSGYTNEFKPANVAYGLSHILPILVSILSAPKDKIILIENPESHIHPRGQSKIGELLFLASQNGVQLFVETHSDHVLNGIRVAINKEKKGADKVGLFFFERNADTDEHHSNIQTPEIDNDGRIKYWPNNFFDEWEKNLMQLV
jgi:predicted ATPase